MLGVLRTAFNHALEVAMLAALLLLSVGHYGEFPKLCHLETASPTPTVHRAHHSAKQQRVLLWGIADTHAHQFANLGFGGSFFWGAPFSDKGSIESGMRFALPSCEPVHGRGGDDDFIGNIVRNRGHKTTNGYPKFDEWPSWDTKDHQQMYIGWLQRAYKAGLRLMVMHAVNAEGLCEKVNHQISCDDATAIELQLSGAKALQDYVDGQSGGRGKGWYQIVTTPADARRVIADGKLAVVLGIEVDDIFDCKYRDSTCTPDRIRKGLDYYQSKGVTHIIPIHLANNGFGGYSLYHQYFDLNNYKLTGRFPDVSACDPRDSLTYHLEPQSFFARLKYQLMALALVGAAPNYPRLVADCNKDGLSPAGKTMISEMMKRGMIIDIDHMSRRSIADALALTSANSYPVISGHTGFSDLALGDENHEGQKTAAELETIRKYHGMVSAIFVQGSTDGIAQWGNPDLHLGFPDNDCSNSSKTWAQAYLYAVSKMGGFDRAAVGMASDQMLNEWFGPRFGDQHCSGPKVLRQEKHIMYYADEAGKHIKTLASDDTAPPQKDSVTYPIPPDVRLVSVGLLSPRDSFRLDHEGDREFNFNHMGMAHIGLLPDFLQDLRNIGLQDNRLDPLFRSAEAYVEMWECAQQRARQINNSRSNHAASTSCS